MPRANSPTLWEALGLQELGPPDDDQPSPFEALGDRKLAQWLFSVRWPDGITCPVCRGRRFRQRPKRHKVWACRRCRHEKSVTARCLLHATHLPLFKWFDVAWRLAFHPALTTSAVERAVRVHRETAWTMLQRFRASVSCVQTSCEGEATFAADPIVVRPPTHHSPELHPEAPVGLRLAQRWMVLFVTHDEHGRLIAQMAPSEHDNPTRDHADPEPTCEADGPARMAMENIRAFLTCVHGTVSARWLDRYLAWFADPPEDDDLPRLMEGLLAAPPARFDDLRPGTHADSVFDPRAQHLTRMTTTPAWAYHRMEGPLPAGVQVHGDPEPRRAQELIEVPALPERARAEAERPLPTDWRGQPSRLTGTRRPP